MAVLHKQLKKTYPDAEFVKFFKPQHFDEVVSSAFPNRKRQEHNYSIWSTENRPRRFEELLTDPSWPEPSRKRPNHETKCSIVSHSFEQ
jgi:hypothetical protein